MRNDFCSTKIDKVRRSDGSYSKTSTIWTKWSINEKHFSSFRYFSIEIIAKNQNRCQKTLRMIMMMMINVNFVRVNDPNANIFVETNALRKTKKLCVFFFSIKNVLPKRRTNVGQTFENFPNVALERILNNVYFVTIRRDWRRKKTFFSTKRNESFLLLLFTKKIGQTIRRLNVKIIG